MKLVLDRVTTYDGLLYSHHLTVWQKKDNVRRITCLNTDLSQR